MAAIDWAGVYPAATTQFRPDMSVDIDATQKVQDGLIRDGVHGLVLMGTVGEGNSLEPEEKRQVLKAALEVAAGRVPVIAGVSEMTTPRAVAFARDAEKLGASGLMVLPAMVYVPTEDELIAHFRAVAESVSTPIMLYNNPPSYRVNIGLRTMQALADLPNVVSLKESSPDTRRFTDIHNLMGDRYVLFAGLDDVALEALMLGAAGWVSGLTNAFPPNPSRCGTPSSAATIRRRSRSTAGSCRCCTSTPSTTWCRPSSSPSRSWAAAPSGSARRATS